MTKRLILFDNDGTLYQIPRVFFNTVMDNIYSGIIKATGKSMEDVLRENKALKEKYKTDLTARAFSKEYGFDLERFNSHIYENINPSDLEVSRDQKLESLLGSLEGEKVIYTNNHTTLARKILNSLGIEGLFEDVIGVDQLDYFSKPSSQSFQLVSEKVGLSNFDEVFFVEDKGINLKPARELGVKTVLVGSGKDPGREYADFLIPTIYELRGVIQ
ncbi:HAD hydrolase-like protein [Candidatus Woesearchaeota archaeon]|jgi:putative hydrolase of the HAD superfamily|nr:HAD hydrolase-like protein [Candidatus Woesearchaeota archaeon]